MKGKLPFYFCSRWGLVQFSSVGQPCLTLRPHGLQHARLPCPSPTPGACSNSCPSSWWCHRTILYSVVHAIQPFYILCQTLFLLSVFPSIRVFSSESVLHIGWPKYWSFSISPSSEYSGLISFRIDWFDILTGQGPLKISNTTVQKHEFFGAQLSLWSNSHIHTGSYSPFFSSVYLTRVCGMCYLKRISLGSSVSPRVFRESLNTSVCNVCGGLGGSKCEQNILLT